MDQIKPIERCAFLYGGFIDGGFKCCDRPLCTCFIVYGQGSNGIKWRDIGVCNITKATTLSLHTSALIGMVLWSTAYVDCLEVKGDDVTTYKELRLGLCEDWSH